MSTQHTPLPWYTELVTTTETGLRASIISARENSHWPSGGRNIAEVGHWRDRVNPEADAEFIVRACNSHDDLLAALERLALMVRQYNDGAIICHRELAQADAAIAKAKGE